MEFNHIPVLLDECLEGLNIRPDGIYCDGTAGGAGHSREIAKRLDGEKGGRLVAIDRDPEAVKTATERLAGYPEPKDVVVCKVWAACTDAGNQHYRAADVMNTEQVINFTIRYRDDIKPGMWVRFREEKWDISTLGEYSFKRTYLGLKASLSKGVSG